MTVLLKLLTNFNHLKVFLILLLGVACTFATSIISSAFVVYDSTSGDDGWPEEFTYVDKWGNPYLVLKYHTQMCDATVLSPLKSEEAKFWWSALPEYSPSFRESVQIQSIISGNDSKQYTEVGFIKRGFPILAFGGVYTSNSGVDNSKYILDRSSILFWLPNHHPGNGIVWFPLWWSVIDSLVWSFLIFMLYIVIYTVFYVFVARRRSLKSMCVNCGYPRVECQACPECGI